MRLHIIWLSWLNHWAVYICQLLYIKNCPRTVMATKYPQPQKKKKESPQFLISALVGSISTVECLWEISNVIINPNWWRLKKCITLMKWTVLVCVQQNCLWWIYSQYVLLPGFCQWGHSPLFDLRWQETRCCRHSCTTFRRLCSWRKPYLSRPGLMTRI